MLIIRPILIQAKYIEEGGLKFCSAVYRIILQIIKEMFIYRYRTY